MEYKHINDCWKALEEVKNIKDIDEVLNSFPRWSGDWDWWTDNGSVMVSNHYDDGDCEDWDTRELEQFSSYCQLDKEEVIEWLSEHDTAAEDFNEWFGVDIFEDQQIDVPLDDILQWIYEHDTLAEDFQEYFNYIL